MISDITIAMKKNTHTYAVLVVTYFPAKEALNNLLRLSQKCNRVIVIDNTPQKGPISFPTGENITIIRLGKNKGLSCALNYGMEVAKTLGIENIFIFDQDTVPSDTYFEQMIKFQKIVEGQNSRIAFCVPNFFDRNCDTYARFPAIEPFSIQHYTCKNLKSRNTDSHIIAITSGMLISISKYAEIGPFRTDYFIDFIDNEYCLRAAAKGYRVEVNCDAVIDHSIGYRIKKTLFGLEIKPNNHPPNRRYYIARNGIRTALDYGRAYPSYIFLIITRLAHEGLSILLFEKKRLQKIRAMFIGVIHAFLGKMGKFDITFSE